MEHPFLMFLDHTQRRTTVGRTPLYECRVLSGRGLCDELITRPEESYRLWCVVVCDLETSRMGAPYDNSRLRVKEEMVPTSLRLTSQTGYGVHIAFFLPTNATSPIWRHNSWNVKLPTSL